MKQILPSEKKRKRTPKVPWEPKSKDEQIISNKPTKSSGKGRRTRVCDIYKNVEDQYMCFERASFLLERLDSKLPKFAKCMLPSNVQYSFWLILPKEFCVMHLPDHDTTITLVDECGKEFRTNYLKLQHGLSAGWRGFSLAQRLLQGDILFFHLIEPCKLQVHIVRRYGIEVVEAAVCLMEMHPRVKRTKTSNSRKEDESKKEKSKHEASKKGKKVKSKKVKKKHRTPKERTKRAARVICASQGDVANGGKGELNVGSKLLTFQCDNCSDAFSSEVLEGNSSETSNDLQGDEVRCCGQKLCQHEGINCPPTAPRIYTSSTVAT